MAYYKGMNEETLFFRLQKHSTVNANGCIEWLGFVNKNGYAYMRFKNKRKTVHRWAYELCFGAIPNGMYVCHKCDNRKCLNINHLFLGTQADNMKDMVSKNRHQKRETKSNAKLTTNYVKLIRQMKKIGFTDDFIAKKFKVCRPLITDVINLKRWA